MNQAEYATDVMFQDRSALAGLYPRLVEHATVCLGAEDVLKFLGRKLHPSFLGEVQTHCGQRVEGTRIKHAMKANRLKMYDKAGCVLRIETVINDPTQFRVRRWRVHPDGSKAVPAGRQELAWQELRKGVAWLWRYAGGTTWSAAEPSCGSSANRSRNCHRSTRRKSPPIPFEKEIRAAI